HGGPAARRFAVPHALVGISIVNNSPETMPLVFFRNHRFASPKRPHTAAPPHRGHLLAGSGIHRVQCYAASVATSMGSIIDGPSFSGLLTRVEIGHIRIGAAGNGSIRSRGSGSSLSQRA